MRATELGWALLLSVPVGVGVLMAVYMTLGDYVLGVGAGGIAALAIFLVVAAGAAVGSEASVEEA